MHSQEKSHVPKRKPDGSRTAGILRLTPNVMACCSRKMDLQVLEMCHYLVNEIHAVWMLGLVTLQGSGKKFNFGLGRMSSSIKLQLLGN